MKAGFKELDITPLLGQMVPGQFHTRYGGGIYDNLYVKAAVFESENERFAIVSADSCLVSDKMCADFRAELKKRAGIDKSMFAATHTHAGGPVFIWGEQTAENTVYADMLINKGVDAVVLALTDMRPAVFRAGKETEDGIAFNRRFIMKDGGLKTNPGIKNPDVLKPAGPTDPDVSVLRVEDTNGCVLGIITNFSCHLDTIGGDKLSGDYPAELSRVLKKVYNKDLVSVFLTAPCGDINHIDVMNGMPDAGIVHTRKMGRILAGKVIAASEKAPVMEPAVLSFDEAKISCPCRQPDLESVEAGRKLIAVEKRSNAELFKAADGSLQKLFYAKEAVRMHDNPEKTAGVLITAARIGELAIVSAPAELFVEFSLDIKTKTKFPHIMVSSLTNGLVGYVPTRDALSSGGYESQLCSTSKMAAETGYMMVDTALKLLEDLYSKN